MILDFRVLVLSRDWSTARQAYLASRLLPTIVPPRQVSQRLATKPAKSRITSEKGATAPVKRDNEEIHMKTYKPCCERFRFWSVMDPIFWTTG